jgi:hypothetical protein
MLVSGSARAFSARFRNHYTVPGGNLQIFFRSVICMSLASLFGPLAETAPVTFAVVILLVLFAIFTTPIVEKKIEREKQARLAFLRQQLTDELDEEEEFAVAASTKEGARHV